jgi:hypothetical protein
LEAQDCEIEHSVRERRVFGQCPFQVPARLAPVTRSVRNETEVVPSLDKRRVEADGVPEPETRLALAPQSTEYIAQSVRGGGVISAPIETAAI